MSPNTRRITRNRQQNARRAAIKSDPAKYAVFSARRRLHVYAHRNKWSIAKRARLNTAAAAHMRTKRAAPKLRAERRLGAARKKIERRKLRTHVSSKIQALQMRDTAHAASQSVVRQQKRTPRHNSRSTTHQRKRRSQPSASLSASQRAKHVAQIRERLSVKKRARVAKKAPIAAPSDALLHAITAHASKQLLTRKPASKWSEFVSVSHDHKNSNAHQQCNENDPSYKRGSQIVQ